jgi:hypothetical protein
MRATSRHLVLLFALAAPIAATGADVLAQLGLTVDAVKEAIGNVLTGGVMNPGLPSSTFKLMPPAARAQAATAGVAWLKSYTASPDFKPQYLQVRESHKPEAPTFELTPEQEIQKAQKDQAQQLEESKKAIAALPPDQRKAVEQSLKETMDLIARMDTPEQRTMRLDAIRQDRAAQQKEYEERLAAWKQAYPDDPKPIVVKRLREFLQLSADIDFNARVVKKPEGPTVFENPAYEAKSSQWKTCFRAGREATTAARAAVQAWLTELGG